MAKKGLQHILIGCAIYLSEHQAIGKDLCCSENTSLGICVAMVTIAGPMFVPCVHHVVWTVCVLLILNVFMAIFGCTCMCHPHFLVSALYVFVHARYREVQGGFMGIFRFIRTWQINGNLGGARVTAPKILISNPKTMQCNGASTKFSFVRLIVMLWRSLDGMFPQLHGLGGDLVPPSPP